MASYAQLHKQNQDMLAQLQQKTAEKPKSGGKSRFTIEDDTFYTTQHIRDDTGVGSVTFRWLPAPAGEDFPYIELTSFKSKESMVKGSGFYNNYSRKNISDNEPDPAAEYNQTIWANPALSKEEKKAAIFDRVTEFVGTILILKDKNKPENVGKVFRFKFGQQIMNQLQTAWAPKFDDQEAFVPFDPFGGKNFVLRVTTRKMPNGNAVPNYEESGFEPNTSAVATEEAFEEIFQKILPLTPFKSGDKIQSYDELKKQVDRVLGVGEASKSFLDSDEPLKSAQSRPAQQQSKPADSWANDLEEKMDDEIPDFSEPKADNPAAGAAALFNDESAEGDDWLAEFR